MTDPITDILQLVRATSVITGSLPLGGDFAFRFRSHGKIKFYSVLRGTSWLRRERHVDALKLEHGDVLLLSGDEHFVLSSDVRLAPFDVCPVFERQLESLPKTTDAHSALLVGVISLDPTQADLLTSALPPFVHVRAASSEATALRWLLERIEREQRAALPGAKVASTELAQLVLVEALRANGAQTTELQPGWFRAMRDERLGAVIRSLHAHPERAWTLDALAHLAAMSRAAFAARFKTVAGIAPAAYLTRWRMRLARRALRESDASVAEIARSVGYTSESAFSQAFKRETGLAPRHYREAPRDEHARLPDAHAFS